MITRIQLQLHKRHFDYAKMVQLFKYKFQTNSTLQYETILVKYKNFDFELSATYLTITGCISTLHQGNNLATPSYRDIVLAFQEIEYVLETSLGEAFINRIHIGCNFLMDYPVREYLDLLQTPATYKMNHFENELKEFRKQNGSLIFNDRIKEAQAKGADLQKINPKKLNILGYEIMFLKPLLEEIGLMGLRFKELYEEDKYLMLVKEWYDKYKAVPKNLLPNSADLNFESISDFKNSFILNGINQMGGVELMEELLVRVDIPKQVRYSLRKYIKKLDIIKPLSPELLLELDKKIYVQSVLAAMETDNIL